MEVFVVESGTGDHRLGGCKRLLAVGRSLRDLQVKQAETTAELKGVVARLDKVNGNIAHLQEESNKHSIELAERRLACPLLVPVAARLDIVEDFIVTTRAMTISNKHWLDRMWPFIYAASGIAVYMLAMHADQLLKAMSR